MVPSKSYSYFTTLVQYLIIFLLWVGFWGLSDNIINLFIPYTSYHARIFVYGIIVLIAFVLIYFFL